MINKKPVYVPDGESALAMYLHAKAGPQGIPLAGTFELTARCNFSCSMCYIHEDADANAELSAEQWIELGRTCAKRGMLFLLLTGGEPLLRPDFVQIYTQLRKLGLMVSVNTNGSLITDEVLDAFKKNPPTRINVSLYGGNNDTYTKLCKNSAFDTVTKNILRLKEAGLSVKLNFAVTPKNGKDIKAIYDFAKKAEIPVQSTAYMYPPIRVNGCKYGEAPHRFSPQKAAEHMLLCREQVFTKEQLENSVFTPIEEDCERDCGDPMSCRAGKTAFWVNWQGKMQACGTFSTANSYDIKELGFDKAWENVKRDTNNIIMPKECSGCAYREKCIVCAACCVAESGDSTVKPEYICTMTKHLHKLIREKYGR